MLLKNSQLQLGILARACLNFTQVKFKQALRR